MNSERTRGFTLIELLIVIVIIGILAAIAIPKYGATKEKAYIAMMVDDLRNLATSEEAYFDDAGAYYAGALPSSALVYSPSTGVSITIDEATGSGWSATATSTRTARHCAIFYGGAAAPAPATEEGVAACAE